MLNKTICILGGSGFVGRHISSLLAVSNYHIKILTRRKDQCQSMTVLPNLQIIETDVHDQNQLNTHFADVDIVINLIGILNERQHNGDGFRRAHVELSRKVLNACHQNKIGRIIHMSALNADAAQGASHYLRTKGEAENMVHSFGGEIKVTSFRPSVIFGADDSFFNRFAGILKLSPFIFPLACADARFAPVYVGDVAHCFVDAINNPATYGQRIDLCGPEIYTLKQLVSFTSQQIGRKHWVISLPDTLSQLQAMLLEYIPGKPFSIDNYDSLQVDSVCDSSKPGIYSPAHSIKSVVPGYLGNHSQHHRDDHYRQLSRRDLK